jgi:hypothetical protein
MKPNTFASIRKIASILLALCFVLPLSQCTQHVERQGQISTIQTNLHGFDMARDGWIAMRRGDPEGALLLLAVANVFFVPAFCLRLGERRQALIQFVGALVSEYILFFWVVVFASRPQVGGLLAMICWAVLFCTSSATLFRQWRSRTLFTRAA